MLIITLVYIARGRKNAGTGGSKRDTRPSRASRSDAFFAFRAISINSVKIKKKKKCMCIVVRGSHFYSTVLDIRVRHFSNVSVPRT